MQGQGGALVAHAVVCNAVFNKGEESHSAYALRQLREGEKMITHRCSQVPAKRLINKDAGVQPSCALLGEPTTEA